MKTKKLISILIIMVIVLSSLLILQNNVYAAYNVTITYNGQEVDSFCGVPAKYENDLNFSGSYPCNEYVSRFYRTIYGVTISNMFLNATPIVDGSYNATQVWSPQPGDIGYQTYNGGPHWMIIKSVSGNIVTVIEQNWKWSQNGSIVTTVDRQLTTSELKFFRASSSQKPAGEPSDTEKPKITSAYVDPASMNGSSYKVRVVASDNVGITKIPIMTWSVDNGQDDIKEYRATKNGSEYSYTVKASNHGNNKGLYNSNVYVYDEAGNGVVKPLSNIPMNTKVVKNLGSFEARIVLKKNQDYVITANGTSQNANVMLGEKSTSDKSQIWKFNQKSDGSYEIVNVASNRALDISDAKDEDGANVAIHSRNNSNAQTFYIMEYNGGYRIVPKCTSNLKAIDLADNKVEKGRNIDLYNVYAVENSAQTWIFEDSSILLGDVNADGKINARDAKLVLQYFNGQVTLTKEQQARADVNKDGKINARDAKLILQKFNGNNNAF